MMHGYAPYASGDMCTPTGMPSFPPTGINPTATPSFNPTGPTYSPTPVPSMSCPDTCSFVFGQDPASCQYWDQFGTIDGVCDYMGVELESGMGCQWCVDMICPKQIFIANQPL